jgi:hypothetical protein
MSLLSRFFEGQADDPRILGVGSSLQVGGQILGRSAIGAQGVGQQPSIPAMFGSLGELDQMIARQHGARVVAPATVCILQVR